MFDKDAIKELSQAQAITAAAEAIADHTVVGLPTDFNLHDLEKFESLRRRPRGVMTTSVIADFAAFTLAHKEPGAMVFIDAGELAATGVLNLGTVDTPGHADNLAKLATKKTAAFGALLSIVNGHQTQTAVAEWMEDWAAHITCVGEAEVIPHAAAVSAVRKLTIEALRRVESEEKQLSVQRSAMESVAAKDTDNLPRTITFDACPHKEAALRTFALRLGIITGDKPKLQLRIVAWERHVEEMAQELADLVREALQDQVPCLVGGYQATR